MRLKVFSLSLVLAISGVHVDDFATAQEAAFKEITGLWLLARVDVSPRNDVSAFMAHRFFWLASSKDSWIGANLRDQPVSAAISSAIKSSCRRVGTSIAA